MRVLAYEVCTNHHPTIIHQSCIQDFERMYRYIYAYTDPVIFFKNIFYSHDFFFYFIILIILIFSLERQPFFHRFSS